VQRRRQDRHEQVHHHVEEGRAGRQGILGGGHVGTDRPRQSDKRRCSQDVAGVEGTLPPRSPHEPVAGQHAEGRGRRPNSGRQQESSQQAWKGAEVDLLLRSDLDRVLLRHQRAREAGRDDEPAPGLGRGEATMRRRHTGEHDADQRHSDDDGLQPRGQTGER
jgi:hypothetical protein